MRVFFFRSSLVGLLLSSVCAAAAVEGRRDVMVASPDLNKVITQTTTRSHQIYFEVCEIDLGKFESPSDVSLVLNGGSASCKTLANLVIDAGDARALKYLRENFVGPLEIIATYLASSGRSDAIFQGAFGTVMVPAFTLLHTDAWSKEFFNRHAASKWIGRPQILVGAALIEAGIIALTYRGIEHARDNERIEAYAHLVRLSGEMARQPYPLVNYEEFKYFEISLTEAIYKTADALTVR